MAGENPEMKEGGQATGGMDFRDRREMRREARGKYSAGGLFWGLVLILLGVLFFVSLQGWISEDSWWHYFLIGLGGIFLIEALVRYANPDHRESAFGRFVAGIILVFAGIAFVFGFDQWWPLALIAAGIALVASFYLKRR